MKKSKYFLCSEHLNFGVQSMFSAKNNSEEINPGEECYILSLRYSHTMVHTGYLFSLLSRICKNMEKEGKNWIGIFFCTSSCLFYLHILLPSLRVYCVRRLLKKESLGEPIKVFLFCDGCHLHIQRLRDTFSFRREIA